MRVAVIGGGMAGLSAARELLRGGAEVVVFEAADRPGGMVGSRGEQGFLTEDGPNFIARPLDALLDAAGLRSEVVHTQGPSTRWVHRGGRALEAPGLSFLLGAGMPRALLEPFFSKPLREDLSLRGFLMQRLGSRAGSLLATLMAAGVYAGDADRLSARDAFPRLGALGESGSLIVQLLRRKKAPRPPLWNLRRGLGSLPLALSAGLGARLRLGAKVALLEPVGREGFQVDGARFDAAVLAVPAQAAADLCRPFAPRFSEALQAGFTSAPVTVLHLGLPQAEVPRGFGMLDADGTLHATGALFPSSMLPGRAPEGQALVTAICGGARNPQHARLPEAELVAAVRADLERTLGIRSAPSYVRAVRWPAAIPQYAVGHRDRVRAARDLLADFPLLEVAGAAWDGVGVPDVVASGAAAAARLLSKVSRGPLGGAAASRQARG